MESANRKTVETMTSTERCGPRLCNDKRDSDIVLQRQVHYNYLVTKKYTVLEEQRSVNEGEYKP